MAKESLLRIGGKFGDYDVVRLLGVGGMAEVYLIRSPSSGALFAAKILSRVPESERAESRARFVCEAEAAQRIVHPNLVKVYDWGEDPDTGLCYIIMDYLDGGTLSARLAAHGSMPINDAVSIAAQLAAALATAHEAGIVHRDIKPDNIMFDSAGTPKILDLGIAKLNGEPSSGKGSGASPRRRFPVDVTMAGTMIGTPAYMAPEQVENSHEVDGRADIYSLGIVLYEMLSGVRPNPDDSVDELIDKAERSVAIADVRISMPEVSTSLAKVVSKMCAVNKSERVQNAREVIRMLLETDEGKAAIPEEIAKFAAPSLDAEKIEKTLVRRPVLKSVKPPELFPQTPVAPGNAKAKIPFGRMALVSVVSACIGALAGFLACLSIDRSFNGGDPSPQPLDAEELSVNAPSKVEDVVSSPQLSYVTITNEIVRQVEVVVTNWVEAVVTPAAAEQTRDAAEQTRDAAEKPQAAATAEISPGQFGGKTPYERVSLAAGLLFPGWKVSNTMPASDPVCGYMTEFQGRKNVMVTLPKNRSQTVRISRMVRVPDDNPVMHLQVAPHNAQSQFRLAVSVSGDHWRTDVKDGWNDILLPLGKWRGKDVKVEISHEPTGWNDEYAYWSKIEIASDPGLFASAVRQSKRKQRKVNPLAKNWMESSRLPFQDVARGVCDLDVFRFELFGDWKNIGFYEEEYLNRYDCLVFRKDKTGKAFVKIHLPAKHSETQYYNPQLAFSLAGDGKNEFSVKVFVKGVTVMQGTVKDKQWQDFSVDLRLKSSSPAIRWPIPASQARIEISSSISGKGGAVYLEGLQIIDKAE